LAFGACLLFGGGAGLGYPLIELACQLLAILMIAAVVTNTPSHLKAAIVFTFAAAAVLLGFQLIPLPGGIWHALPESEVAGRILAQTGRGASWHALSLTPDRTLSMLFSFLVPFAAMLVMADLRLSTRIIALRLILGGAVIAAVFAALQVAAGGAAAPILYETAHRGYGVGFFVNRNHQATLLLIAIVISAVPGVTGERPTRHVIMLAIDTFLAMGILATSSRTGLVLLPLAILGVAALTLGVRRSGRAISIVGGLYLVVGLLLTRTELVGRVLGRFESISEELRYQYWDNTLYALGRSFPYGTGFGSFERIYRSVEPIEQVSPFNVNHVHNDFLELALEGGLPAVVLMVVAGVVLVRAVVAGWRGASGRQERSTVVAAIVSIGIVLLFSLVDYPLRMAAIAGLFGAMLGLIVAAARSREPARPNPGTDHKRRRWTVTALAIAVGATAAADASARFLVLHGAGTFASQIAPWSADAWAARAEAEQRAGQQVAARESAARALGIVPIDAKAVRVHGFADLLLGQTARGTALLETGAALGWRDTLLQLWLIDRARQAGASGIAAERIDALLRRAQVPEQMMQQMRLVYAAPGGVDAVVARLGDRPPWRRGFFNAVADDAANDLGRTAVFLDRLRARGIPATPDETLLIRGRLGERGKMQQARAIWFASGGVGEIPDGGFERTASPLPTGVFPYAWSQIATDGVKVILADRGVGGSAHAVEIVSDGLTSAIPLVQAIALPPGNWELSAQVRGSDVPAALVLTCANKAQTAAASLRLSGPGQDWRRVSGSARIGTDCPAQILGISIEGHDAQVSPIWIDDVRVLPARPH
jgi:O-antigen ligase